MARQKGEITIEKELTAYTYNDKNRLNIPPAGFAQYDKETEKNKKYTYDPNIDPILMWAGKTERTSFEVPTVSLHVHETVNPYRILDSVRKKSERGTFQATLFDAPTLRAKSQLFEFYKHKKGWTNRLIAGDSLLVMNSLLERESMAGKVQMVYIDPPYGIKYGSNFQPFTDNKNVQDGKDEDLTHEPEMIKAFRDTWELGIHSYLTYLRDRILLARELLSESGSIFVQISDENIHHVREICDEIFGPTNFISIISYVTTSGFQTSTISRAGDYIIWYAKSKSNLKYRPIFKAREFGSEGSGQYTRIELSDGSRMSISEWEKKNNCKFNYKTRPAGSKVYSLGDTTSPDPSKTPQPFEYNGKVYTPNKDTHWKANYPEGMRKLADAKRLDATENRLGYVRYFEDFPYMQINNMWKDTGSSFMDKKYVVQTAAIAIERCLLMSTDPGDLVLDITCGSGTTAYVAEKRGRRWITCDTSRIAITLAKQRLITSVFDYYELAGPNQNVSEGFIYKTVKRVTLGSIANDEPPEIVDLYDQPVVDETKTRITGPFTIEAIPSPTVQTIDELYVESDVTAKQSDWREELRATGILINHNEKLEFSRVEPLSGTKYLQADAETKEETPRKAVICFAGETRPLDSRIVNYAIQEALTIRPSPTLVIFCAFQFDPEATKDIKETNWPGITLLSVQMNADLLTEDLMKKRSSNQSFWLIGQPDVICEKISEGKDAGKYYVKIRGFDYYNPKTGEIQSGNDTKIAMWMLDTDYDGMVLNPSQLFFPMAKSGDGWSKLAKTLKAELNPNLIHMYQGIESIPFSVKEARKIAVKIIDNRGIESMKVLPIGE